MSSSGRGGGGGGSGGAGGAAVRHGSLLAAAAATGLVLFGAAGLVTYFSQGGRGRPGAGGSEGGGGTGGAGASSSASSASSSSAAAAGSGTASSSSAADAKSNTLLATLDRMIQRLEDGTALHTDGDNTESESMRSSMLDERGGSSGGGGGGPGSRSRLDRVLRDIRTKRWKKKGVQLSVLHRLRMAQLLMLYHRSPVSAASVQITPSMQAAAEEQRRLDYELCWILLHNRAAEAEAMHPSPPFPSDARSEQFASAPFAPPSLRNQLLHTLLEVSHELRDRARMWSALCSLLRVPEADLPGASASSPSGSPGAPASASVPVLSPALLLSLDRDSLLVAFTAAPVLGCWLWTYQCGLRLFGARRCAQAAAASGAASGAAFLSPRAQAASSSSASSPSSASSSSSPSSSDLYNELHATALDSSSAIDYSIVYELATLRVLAHVERNPALLEQMGLRRNQIAESLLPFDEEGRHVDEARPAAPSVSVHSSPEPGAPSPSSLAGLHALPPLSSLLANSGARRDARGLPVPLPPPAVSPAPLPLLDSSAASLCFEEWEILAYSCSVVSVHTPDDRLAAQLLPMLREQVEPCHRLPSTLLPAHHHYGQGGGLGLAPSGPIKRIQRAGRLFSMTGLFSKAIPVVGTITHEPHAHHEPESNAHTAPATAFSMQGYTFVPPTAAAGGAASSSSSSAAPPVDDSYTQFEFYSFRTGEDLHRSGSSGSSSGSSSSSNGITNSLVDFSAAQASEACISGSSSIAAPSALPSAAGAGAHVAAGVDVAHAEAPSTPTSASAHLFESASFASLADYPEHFARPQSRQHSATSLASSASASPAHLSGALSSPSAPLSPLLSPESAVAAAAGGAVSPLSALDRFGASLPAALNAELWSGAYRVVQAPSAPSGRTHVEVHYDCRLLVARVGPQSQAEAAAARRPDAYSGPVHPPPDMGHQEADGDSDRLGR